MIFNSCKNFFSYSYKIYFYSR